MLPGRSRPVTDLFHSLPTVNLDIFERGFIFISVLMARRVTDDVIMTS